MEFSNFGNSSFEASTYEEANVIESDYKQENGDKNNGNYLEPGCFYQENSNFFVAYISFDFIAMFLFPLSVSFIEKHFFCFLNYNNIFLQHQKNLIKVKCRYIGS